MGKLCTFVAVYAPNTGQTTFRHTLLGRLLDFVEGPLFLMGDFNLIWQKELDSTHSHRSDLGSFSSDIQQLHDMGLLDAWRTLYPLTKDYTFYSRAHRTYSRLDYIFLSQSLLGDLQEAKIFPLSVSDHSLCAISMSWNTNTSVPRRWYFPTALTRDKESCTKLREAITEFFNFNKPDATSDFTTWDAFKAAFRGTGISLNSALNAHRIKEREALETELSSTEQAHKLNPTRQTLRSLTALQGKL